MKANKPSYHCLLKVLSISSTATVYVRNCLFSIWMRVKIELVLSNPEILSTVNTASCVYMERTSARDEKYGNLALSTTRQALSSCEPGAATNCREPIRFVTQYPMFIDEVMRILD